MKKFSHKFEVLGEFVLRDSETGLTRVAKVGEIIDLSDDVIFSLLERNLITPYKWPERIECEVLRPGVTEVDGKLYSLKPGEIVELSKEQAVFLMVRRLVRACDRRYDLSLSFVSK